MNYQKLTIGQMAEINQGSRQTLRHYDAEGLLVPSVVDEATGYRYYHLRLSARLDMIQYMKSLGLGLPDIQSHIHGRDTRQIVRLLDETPSDVANQIPPLQQHKTAIRRMSETIQRL